MAKTKLSWNKTREGVRSALWQAQDEHAGLQFDIQRGVLTDNLYVLTVYPLDDSTAAPLGFKSAVTMAEVKRKAEGYRGEYRSGHLLNPARWNPTQYETYDLTIHPETAGGAGRRLDYSKRDSWRAALEALRRTKILDTYDVQYGDRPGPIRVNELEFTKFRKLVSALATEFEGFVDVKGEVRIHYGMDFQLKRRGA